LAWLTYGVTGFHRQRSRIGTVECMSQATPGQAQPASNAERLRVAMGWERLPEMSAEEREKFDADQRRFDEEIRRFYADPAA
jgi:hypothetical protein